MFKVNEYFEGQVKSLAFNVKGEKATVGVMAVGEYEFSTDSTEHMTLISGAMLVMLPKETKWRAIEINETFIIAKNASFRIKVDQESAYLCVFK